MSETLYSDIRAALELRLAAMPLLPDVAWENKSYTPTLGVPYISTFIMWAEGNQAELGEDGRNWERGIFQLTLRGFAPDSGPNEADTLAGQIREWFKRGTIVSSNGVNVTIRKVYLSPNNIINIAFYCNAAN